MWVDMGQPSCGYFVGNLWVVGSFLLSVDFRSLPKSKPRKPEMGVASFLYPYSGYVFLFANVGSIVL